jgi:alkanesulfonate monooxygenase SsuD/methylene tetrahydromethanopterin reductase-like flavin-dependent oxidoreductase (luciferase family)
MSTSPHDAAGRTRARGPSAAGTSAPGRGLLLLELDGSGSHPAAWRATGTAPASVLTPARLRAVVLAAETAGFHAATFSDAQLPDDASTDTAARLNALQRAAFTGPITRSIALIPEVDTVYTEPFHVSTQLASLDYVSGGRAGWLVAASTSPADAAAVGRNAVGTDRAAQEAGDSIEVSRRLWDSWEDDAVIRDVPTGRYLDVDKLHYADFHSTSGPDGRSYSVKGPSIIPRPLQGQLPVLAPAGLLTPEAVAGGGADALLVSAPTPELLAAEITASRDTLTAASGPQGGPALIAELDVVLDSRGQSAAGRLARLDSHAPWESPRARFVGTAAELTGLLEEVLAVADGIRLHPAVLDTDLEELATLVLPELRRRGVLAPLQRDATFREQLGLSRPASRYAADPAASTANASAGN